MTGAERNRAIVTAAFAAWAGGTGSVFDLLSNDATWTIPGSGAGAGEWRGRETYLDAVVQPLFSRLAQPTAPQGVAIWADGDQVIVRWRQDTPLRRGGRYRNDYAWFFTMQGGKAVHVTAFLDLAAYCAAVEGET